MVVLYQSDLIVIERSSMMLLQPATVVIDERDELEEEEKIANVAASNGNKSRWSEQNDFWLGIVLFLIIIYYMLW